MKINLINPYENLNTTKIETYFENRLINSNIVSNLLSNPKMIEYNYPQESGYNFDFVNIFPYRILIGRVGENVDEVKLFNGDIYAQQIIFDQTIEIKNKKILSIYQDSRQFRPEIELHELNIFNPHSGDINSISYLMEENSLYSKKWFDSIVSMNSFVQNQNVIVTNGSMYYIGNYIWEGVDKR